MRKFGVELEMKGLNAWQIAECVQQAGASCVDRRNSYGSSSAYPNDWQVTYDGSVSNGYELISPPMDATDENFALLARVVAGLKTAGATVDKQCGYHVHVYADDLDIVKLRALYVLFLRYEGTLDKLVVARRRGNQNQYCQSNRATLSRHHVEAGSSKRDAALARVVAAADRTALLNMAGRYMKLNLQSLLRHGTVEFRGHHASLTPEAVEVWARLCVALVVKAATMTKLPSAKMVGRLDSLLNKLPVSLRARLVARYNVMRALTNPNARPVFVSARMS